MRDNTLLQKNKRLVCLKFVLSLSGSLLLSSVDLFGMDFFDTPETPQGFYKKKKLPTDDVVLKSVSLPLQMTPVKNQHPLGTCVSFAVSACGEYIYRNQGKRFSEAEFTILAETQLPKEDCKPGLFLGQAIDVAEKWGFVDEKRFPYQLYINAVAEDNEISPYGLQDVKNPIICRRKFSGRTYNPILSYNSTMQEMGVNLALYGTQSDIGYPLAQTYPIHHVSKEVLSYAVRSGRKDIEGSIGKAGKADIKSVKKALLKGFPVAIALPVFDGCWDNADIKMPNYFNPTGSHVIVLTGFNDSTQMLRFKNSWGTTWGDKGYGNLPYNYMELLSTELVAIGE